MSAASLLSCHYFKPMQNHPAYPRNPASVFHVRHINSGGWHVLRNKIVASVKTCLICSVPKLDICHIMPKTYEGRALTSLLLRNKPPFLLFKHQEFPDMSVALLSFVKEPKQQEPFPCSLRSSLAYVYVCCGSDDPSEISFYREVRRYGNLLVLSFEHPKRSYSAILPPQRIIQGQTSLALLSRTCYRQCWSA